MTVQSDGRADARGDSTEAGVIVVTTSRRGALWTPGGAVTTALAACGGSGGARATGAVGGGERSARGGEHHEEEEVTPNEDLMREHGVLRRIFLVYDEVARRARAGAAYEPAALARAARLVRTFAEDYHERSEERWVFPVAARAPALAAPVDVLRAQHQRGREITDVIARLAGQGAAAGAQDAARLATLCEGFVRMYRAHASYEDTVVFPAMRAGLSEHAYRELGEQMEQAEHATVGEGGFERAVAEVTELERALGIEDLAHFTPPAPTG